MTIHSILLFTLLGVALSGCPSGEENQSTTTKSINDSEAIVQQHNATGMLQEQVESEIKQEEKPVQKENNAQTTETSAAIDTDNNNTQPPQEKPRDRPRAIHPYVIIANPPPVEGKNTSMKINSASVNQGMLTVEISYGGGCRTHVIELYSSGVQNEAGVINLILADAVTDDHCKKLITETLTFDIKRLKDPERQSLQLRINDHKPPVTWNYGR